MLYEFRALMNECALCYCCKPLTFVGCIWIAISTECIYPLALCGHSYGISWRKNWIEIESRV